MAEVVVRTTDLAKQYGEGENAVHALNGVTCAIYSGEYLSIVGPSGSGKSTLFNMIGGLDRPTGGSVFINSVDIAQLTPKELAFLRCHTIGYIFQTFNLITVRTALENVVLPMLFAGLSPEDAEERAMKKLDLVGLGHRYHHRPAELSGGQQQRVAIARALIADPAIIVADEPTGDLDRKSAGEILALLRRLNEEMGKTIVMVTHDWHAVESARRVAHLEKGELVDAPAPHAAGSD